MARKKTTAKKRGVGRHSRLTAELIKKICALIRKDNFFNAACRACGITEQTGYNWKVRGRAEEERVEKGEVPNENEALYLEFFLEVDQADAIAWPL